MPLEYFFTLFNNNYLLKNRGLYSAYTIANCIILGGIVFVLVYPPLSGYFGYGLKCQTQIISGVQCSSCGLTRGISSCWDGDFELANRYNLNSSKFFFLASSILISRLVLCLLSLQKNSVMRNTNLFILFIEAVTIITIFYQIKL